MKNAKLTICFMAVIMCLAAGQVFGELELNDGRTYDIWWYINSGITVDASAPGMGTTLNLLEGGGAYYICGYYDSHINIYNGKINYSISVYQNSELTICGGEIGDYLYARNDSKVTITNSSIGHDLSVTDGGKVTISDVLVWGNLLVAGNGNVTMSGGNMGDLIATDNSETTMSGGEIGHSITLSDQSILTLDGHSFAIDGVPIGYGGIYSCLGLDYSWEPTRRLTGIFSNGDIINNDFCIGESGSIFLVPEPAALFPLGIGGLFLSRRRKGKRKASWENR